MDQVSDAPNSTPSFDRAEFYRVNSEDLDFLPFSHAFEQVMKDSMLTRSTHYSAAESVEIEDRNFPTKLREALFFPERSEVDNLSAELTEQTTEDGVVWLFTMGFSMDDVFNYDIKMSSYDTDAAFLSTEGLDGEIVVRLDQRTIVELMLTVLYAHIDRLHVQNMDVHELFGSRYDALVLSPDALRRLLMLLGDASGYAETITTSSFPYENGDRAVIAKMSEKESTDTSLNDVSLELGWEFPSPDINSELSVQIGKSATGNPSDILRYGSISSTDVPVEDFVTSKEMGELFGSEQILPRHIVNPRYQPDRWQMLANVFMTTIRPALEQYKNLDQDV